jgi:CRISPR type III-A-associated RAMP protein Csm4
MNPGMVVKLRPTGPWRIGPDSGARNRVDAIYHSDSLYAALTSAMARMGALEEWLDATARSQAPAVCFSSCFPFLDEIGFVVPPRSLWPPTSPALMSARVRWKSARFVPLGIVQAVLAGQTLDENHWAIDGPSECLVPAGRPGPFRSGIRWNAAVDRLTGVSERHFTACVEFRPGAGLWTIVSFADDAARDRWSGPVKTAFRWLADSGFGGERSRGWGRAEAPEFIEGTLPGMILGDGGQGPGAREAHVEASGPDVLPGPPLTEPTEPSPVPPIEEPVEPPPPDPEPGFPTPEPEPAAAAAEGALEPATVTEPSPAPGPRPPAPGSPVPHWLLSLFTPAPSDGVDWSRGNYTLVTRGGRVDASGELKKLVQMVAEGSVIYSADAPRGGAPDVAPDGYAHPVFRAGFALAIPLAGQEGHPL